MLFKIRIEPQWNVNEHEDYNIYSIDFQLEQNHSGM